MTGGAPATSFDGTPHGQPRLSRTARRKKPRVRSTSCTATSTSSSAASWPCCERWFSAPRTTASASPPTPATRPNSPPVHGAGVRRLLQRRAAGRRRGRRPVRDARTGQAGEVRRRPVRDRRAGAGRADLAGEHAAGQAGCRTRHDRLQGAGGAAAAGVVRPVVRRRSHGKQLVAAAARLLVELVGAEMGLLDQELAKLAAYVGERQAHRRRRRGRSSSATAGPRTPGRSSTSSAPARPARR